MVIYFENHRLLRKNFHCHLQKSTKPQKFERKLIQVNV